MQFTAENKAAFDRIVSRYPVKRSALLPGLHLVQDQEGYISSEAIEYLASLLELTNRRVRSTEDIVQMLDLPVLARIGSSRRRSPLPVSRRLALGRGDAA